ncbi:MAG: TonB-dependent receptor plug domain-containing protein, partial [Rhodobacteraceae bacterium]|nr:TonB-dependent receptor plug domain-containing protein [Paracoccaceae bacterium]
MRQIQEMEPTRFGSIVSGLLIGIQLALESERANFKNSTSSPLLQLGFMDSAQNTYLNLDLLTSICRSALTRIRFGEGRRIGIAATAIIVSGHLSAQTPVVEDPVQKLPSVAITSSSWAEISELPRLDASLNRIHLSPHLPLAQALEAMPSVTFARRGANAVEPVIRGFSFDRISTHFNGLPLINASPTRTTAPINFFRSGLIGQVSVQRSFPSVTTGPITTGGVFSLTSFPADSAGTPPQRP